MIEKLSDAIETVKKNWPDERYTMLRDALETLINHAQIDAQAKTMEQIALSDLRDYAIDMEKVREFMADYKLDFDRDMMNIFEAKLAGFLAAGGTIKE